MKVNVFIIVAFLAAVVPSVRLIKCYICSNSDGNCNTGKTTCIGGFQICQKLTISDAFTEKSCTSKADCNAAKNACKSSGKCKAYCCDSDLCNAGVPLKPVTFLALLAMALGVAKYLM